MKFSWKIHNIPSDLGSSSNFAVSESVVLKSLSFRFPSCDLRVNKTASVEKVHSVQNTKTYSL